MRTRNVTLTLPADLLRRAKIVAAARETSLSSLVADYLENMTTEEDDYDEMWEAERRLMDHGLAMRVGDVTWSREDVHER